MGLRDFFVQTIFRHTKSWTQTICRRSNRGLSFFIHIWVKILQNIPVNRAFLVELCFVVFQPGWVPVRRCECIRHGGGSRCGHRVGGRRSNQHQPGLHGLEGRDDLEDPRLVSGPGFHQSMDSICIRSPPQHRRFVLPVRTVRHQRREFIYG